MSGTRFPSIVKNQRHFNFEPLRPVLCYVQHSKTYSSHIALYDCYSHRIFYRSQ